MRYAYVALASALMVAGCGWRQQHILPGFGSSFDRAFAAQQVRSPGGTATAVRGLDAQEAAIISDTYRKDLAPKGAKVEEQPMVIVAPPSRDRAQPLPPSVPKI